MGRWDQQRYDTLETKVTYNFTVFNELDMSLPLESDAGRKAQTRLKMEAIRKDLCNDFQEMVRLYERALNIPLGDHYSLYETCNQPISAG
jgi:hypothetical protein